MNIWRKNMQDSYLSNLDYFQNYSLPNIFLSPRSASLSSFDLFYGNCCLLQ